MSNTETIEKYHCYAEGRPYLIIKRCMDIIIASFGLILFSPLMLTIALGIHFFSPGPILYRQKRIGKNGQLFEMLKFRSMRLENAPDIHREYVQKLIRYNKIAKLIINIIMVNIIKKLVEENFISPSTYN